MVSGALTEASNRRTLDDNRYAFELLDASDALGAKVLIRDGIVYGPNDNGNYPSGMGANNYVLGVFNGDQIWLIITIDPNTRNVTSITINRGPSTPASSNFTRYVTIGYISVDSSGVHPSNALCGNYVIPFSGPDVSSDYSGVAYNASLITFKNCDAVITNVGAQAIVKLFQNAPTSGTWIFGTINGVFNYIPTTSC